jgi:hypothetical protein
MAWYSSEPQGQHPFQKGKGAHEAALVSHVEGRSEDVAVQRCVALVGNRSQATSRLTRGGRQLVEPKENRLLKWNGLEKRYSWAERKLWRKIWADIV